MLGFHGVGNDRTNELSTHSRSTATLHYDSHCEKRERKSESARPLDYFFRWFVRKVVRKRKLPSFGPGSVRVQSSHLSL